MGPSFWVGRDKSGTYRAIGYIRITAERGVSVETAMRAQNFPILQSEAVIEILTHQLYQKLLKVLEESIEPTALERIHQKVSENDGKYQMSRISTFG